MLKKVCANLLLLAAISAAVFGFLTVSSMMMDGMTDGHCLASLLASVICPMGTNFDSLAFHLNFLRAFSLAVFAAAVSVIFIADSYGKIFEKINNSEIKISSRLFFDRRPNDTNYLRKISRFVNFHIESPAFS